MAIGESRREVRITWIGFTILFALFGSISLYKGGGAFPYLYGASAFFALFAALAPMTLLPLYRLWAKFAMGMAWFNTRLLLGIIFFLLVTPLAVVMRAMDKDILDEKIDRAAASYWKKKELDRRQSRYHKTY